MSPMLTTLLQVGAVVASILVLWRGADGVVDNAVAIARRFHVSELVIGLTLVALGTSAPEFAVSIGAALRQQADISVGNIIGSNTFNLGFILGGAALIRPIATGRTIVFRDGLFLLGITLLLALMLYDVHLARWEATVMLALLVSYSVVLFRKRATFDADYPPEASGDDDDLAHRATSWLIGGLVLGLVAVVLGAELLVWGASGIARSLGLSEWAIGVTIVAAGTSAPEVVTTLNAALKDKHGISAGGLIGSDIYNLLGVLGIAAFIRPMTITDSSHASIMVLVAMVALVVVLMRTGWRVSRFEGGLLLAINAVRWWFDMRG